MAAEVARSRSLPRVPLAPIALAVAAGIGIDRGTGSVATWIWGLTGLALAALVLSLGRWGRLQRYVLVAAFVAVGASWHHWWWSDAAPDALECNEDSLPQPAWLRGVVWDVPEFHPPERAGEDGFTQATLALTGISDGQHWSRASGRVRATISGDRRDLQAGMPVTVAGELSAIPGPTNPGEVDYRDVLRAEGIRHKLSVGEAESIEPVPDGRRWWGRWLLGRVRTWSHDRLVSHLDSSVAPLAAALLLGRREAVAPDVNDAFARTGTTHLLAISGLQFQVLAGAIGIACSILRMRDQARPTG